MYILLLLLARKKRRRTRRRIIATRTQKTHHQSFVAPPSFGDRSAISARKIRRGRCHLSRECDACDFLCRFSFVRFPKEKLQSFHITCEYSTRLKRLSVVVVLVDVALKLKRRRCDSRTTERRRRQKWWLQNLPLIGKLSR